MHRPLPLAASALLLLAAVARTQEFAAGHLFVTFAGTNQIVEFNAKGHVVASFGDLAPLSGAWGLAFLTDGRLLVASRENDSLAVFTPNLAFVGSVTATGLDGPQGIEVGPAGRIYVASTHTDAVIALEASFTPFESIPGYPVWPIDGTTMLAFSADGRLLIGSYFNDLLLECQDDGQATGVFPGLAKRPECVSLARNGALLVTSSQENTVRVLAAGRFLLPDLDLTHPDLKKPMGVAEGPDGRIYVASADNGRVLALTPTDADVWFDAPGSFPVGVAWSPWWFEARVTGELLPAQSAVSLTVDESVRLALFPGNGRAFIVPAAGGALATNFGNKPFVVHGVDQGDAKSTKTTSLCAEQRSHDGMSTPRVALGITRKQKTTQGVLDVTSAKGTLHVSSGSVIFRGDIKTTKALN